MKLQTQVPLSKATHQIDYSSQVLLFGSCFSEHMGGKLNYYKFQNVQNPLGILFHPLSIENLITKSIGKVPYTAEDIFYLNERWHCFDAHSTLSDVSKESLLIKLNRAIEHTNSQMVKASHIIITLGTAWVYRHVETTKVVANCHKVPQTSFTKELLEIDFIQERLEHMVAQVHSINPTVQFIFTVSPVRHLKDGFIANQRSKAHLISAVHKSISKGMGLYFPSYELMMDELRDYRFYSEDMVHPSSLAIDYIWEKFVEVFVDDSALRTMLDVQRIQRGLAHRPFNPDSENHQRFVKNLEEQIRILNDRLPFINFP